MSLDASILVSGITGLIAGAIGSLVVPWVKWGIEKKRIVLDNKRRRIEEWRKRLSQASSFEEIRSSVFQDLRPFMTRKDIEYFSGAWVTIGPRTIDPEQLKLAKLLSVVNEIERKWKLI